MMVRQNESALKKILVASDSRDDLLEAVEKAAMVEHYTGASITVLLVIYDPVTEILVERYNPEVSQRIVADLVRNERQALEALLAPCRKHVADLVAEVVFARDTANSICAAARADSADLILKPIARSAHLADFLHTPLDWQLMREAPCPVLFTRSSKWQKPIRVLAALDVMDAGHVDLNKTILRSAALTAAILGGELHVATAYPALAPYVNQYQVAQDFSSIRVQLRDMRRDALTRLLHDLGITAAATYVEEGRPRDIIRALAAQLSIGLTVVGTAGRSGIKKLLIGNTAEQIIGNLPTDLLTVRASTR
jgi:universal stress protein E